VRVRFGDKTVVVTGAGGFIGSAVVERLVADGAQVRAMLRYTSRGQRGSLGELPDATMRDVDVTLGDVRDADAVREVLRGAHVVFHLAASVGIPYSYEHPQEVIDTNIIGTSNVLIAAKELGTVERIILTSTSEVYGSALRIPIDEQHPLQAQSPYSATKIAADALGLSFSRSFGMPVTIVRPFNAYGPRQSARAVIPTIISQALAGKALKLGTLETTRDFTFVEDTARGFVAVGESDAALGEVVNLGSGTETSIGEIVQRVGEIVGRELEVAVDDRRLRPEKSEVSRLHSDSSKALELAGWRAEVSLDEGLRRTSEWIQAHLHEYRTEEYAV
jgi:dTDP-glucose 4,6-dehydratase